MKFYSHKSRLDFPVSVSPMGEIEGFPVRPGMFDVNGATALPGGVNFTVHTHDGTSVELLLFHKKEDEPYAVLPFLVLSVFLLFGLTEIVWNPGQLILFLVFFVQHPQMTKVQEPV